MRDLVRLTRPVDFVLFVAAVLLGGWLAGAGAAFAGEAGWRLAFAALAGALIGVGANVVNDIYDREIDRRNHLDRPLAMGRVSVRAAWVWWAVLSAAGVAAGFVVSVPHGAVAVAVAALVWAYSAWLKRVPGVGHLVVGGVVALGVLYGAMVAREAGVGAGAGGLGLAPWGAVLTLVLVAAREVVKAIPDVEGDRAEGARTLPVVLGPRRAAWLALVTVGASVAALPAFPLLGFDPLFLAWSVPMGACLLAAVWTLLAADARASLRPGAAAWRAGAVRASAWMKAAMALAVLALALGR